MVVEAVYSNGGRFLDIEGNDIGFKRSMDKAMKALKDRRHIKTRKVSTRVQNAGPSKDNTEDGVNALLLLRNCAGSYSSGASANATSADGRSSESEGHEEDASTIAEEERKKKDATENALKRIVLPPGLGARLTMDNKRSTEAADETPKADEDEPPVQWQSVIVSRESPQASLAEMLVNAKQRLDALSQIQQAVSAPICLIYPPIQQISHPSQIALQQYLQYKSSQENHPENHPVARGSMML